PPAGGGRELLGGPLPRQIVQPGRQLDPQRIDAVPQGQPSRRFDDADDVLEAPRTEGGRGGAAGPRQVRRLDPAPEGLRGAPVPLGHFRTAPPPACAAPGSSPPAPRPAVGAEPFPPAAPPGPGGGGPPAGAPSGPLGPGTRPSAAPGAGAR